MWGAAFPCNYDDTWTQSGRGAEGQGSNSKRVGVRHLFARIFPLFILPISSLHFEIHLWMPFPRRCKAVEEEQSYGSVKPISRDGMTPPLYAFALYMIYLSVHYDNDIYVVTRSLGRPQHRRSG